MWCLTETQCAEWAKNFLPFDGVNREIPATEKHGIIVTLSSIQLPQLAWFGDFVASSLRDFDECLLWITQFGVWRENLFLYYRLRESYGERRQLADAPGHLFLRHEECDLAGSLQIAILNGWDFHLLTNFNYVRGVGSHDGFLHILTDDDRLAAEAKEALDGAKIGYRLKQRDTLSESSQIES